MNSTTMESTSGRVRWMRPHDRSEQTELQRWAQAVGHPVIRGPAGHASTSALRELSFAIWNTNVGAGDLAGFIADFRRGALTNGRPVEHFVLLLQEAHRYGRAVPATLPRASLGARRITSLSPSGQRIGIDIFAERAGLALYYVPSMRNGFPGSAAPPEDRGNAILSTLPLSGFRAYELPLERQRRVAIAATVRGTGAQATTWRLDWVNVHLDPRSSPSRFHRSFGSGRARQTEWLVRAIEGPAPALVGGDFNTWTRGAGEPALRHMRSHFPGGAVPAGGSFAISRFLPPLRLDHVFSRFPRAWHSECAVVEPRYGSDHRALIGRIHFG